MDLPRRTFRQTWQWDVEYCCILMLFSPMHSFTLPTPFSLFHKTLELVALWFTLIWFQETQGPNLIRNFRVAELLELQPLLPGIFLSSLPRSAHSRTSNSGEGSSAKQPSPHHQARSHSGEQDDNIVRIQKTALCALLSTHYCEQRSLGAVHSLHIRKSVIRENCCLFISKDMRKFRVVYFEELSCLGFVFFSPPLHRRA